MAKINIFVKNKRGTIQKVLIDRKSLIHYRRVRKMGRRWLWDRVKSSPASPVGFRVKRGRTELFEKRFVRFRFPMYRRVISFERIDNVISVMKKKYNLVKRRNRNLVAQRIAVLIASDPHTIEEKKNKKTNRMRRREVFDAISTITYERSKESTDFMFEELKEKLLDYIMHTTASPSLLDEEVIYKLKDFLVIFSEQ